MCDEALFKLKKLRVNFIYFLKHPVSGIYSGLLKVTGACGVTSENMDEENRLSHFKEFFRLTVLGI